MAQDVVTIPKWFISAVSVILCAAIPWAYTISLDINTLTVKLEGTMEIKEKVDNHLKDHISRVEFNDIKRRLEKLEK